MPESDHDGGNDRAATPPDAGALSEHIERILDELEGVADSRIRERAEELVRTLMSFYGAGFSRILDIASERGGAQLVDTLAADELVGSLLVLHDLHPESTVARVGRALDSVRPYLGAHSGDVELRGVDEQGVLHLRLTGTCDGCPSSTVTVKYAIERAVNEAAPEIADIEVAGVAAEEPQYSTADGQTLIPLAAVDSRASLECPVPETP